MKINTSYYAFCLMKNLKKHLIEGGMLDIHEVKEMIKPLLGGK